MKKYNLTSLIICISSVLLLPAIAPANAGGVGSVDFGITNAVLTGSATTTALGVSTVTLDQQDKCTLVLKGTAIVTNTATATLVLARVDGSGNVETTPRITQTVTIGTSTGASTTNSFVAFIDVPITTLNASYGLSLVSITTTNDGGSVATPVLTCWKKRLQAPN